ncbi:hypothetical protein B0T26DRAFT_641820 [Lasiosphaeria miniovina]|uniref:Zn(2)-C6 fungal-type domain-containing protein n=1 Tax=Lasiosphaeria miniovina TaxID=1954250 RepID=A0AA40AUA8_9PEZI|nr:uncharacterized protein B0T26DRAFT_641820 [Lasiosphaeria miniovina]KAK0722143.1 hypothetical protein B0T26DRAFT_641820 [Lasiosphaeria miniovina]
MQNPPKKRRRPALACEQCRLRKVRCDRASPCATCTRLGNPECTYVPPLPLGASRRPRPAAVPAAGAGAGASMEASVAGSYSGTSLVVNKGPLPPGSGSYPTPSIVSSAATIDSLERRLKQLERELQSALGRQPSPSPPGTRDQSPPLYAPAASTDVEKSFVSLPIRGTMSKTRFFGQSHWVHGTTMTSSSSTIMDLARRDKTFEMYTEKCKSIGRAIKARRVPPLSALAVGMSVPTRPVADVLINGYLRTFETVYRILHVPSFLAEYERYWEQPHMATQAFIVLMQVCMAIGACFHDDTYSLRAQATGWIYEALVWLVLPPEKARLSIPGLQIMCLLQLAKQTAGVGGDLTWISAGSLLRAAMHTGLHHDPDTLVPMPRLRAELRRRLWTTILEICLQASLDAGGLPLISLSNFDTKPPTNINDEEIVLSQNGSTDVAVATDSARSSSSFSHVAVQIALFKSFATRLTIANLINDPQVSSKSPKYHETLRLSTELVAENRALMQRLRSFPSDELGAEGVSIFQFRLLEITMNRYLLALHLSWWRDGLHSPTHYFSRKTSVDAALTLVALARNTTVDQVPDNGLSPEQQHLAPTSSASDFDRFIICGSGFPRSMLIQACLVVSLEYLSRKEEDRNNLGTVVKSPSGEAELHAVFDWVTDWWKNRIRAGETNIKSYVFGPMLIPYVDVLESGTDSEAGTALIMQQATGRAIECYEMLKTVAKNMGMIIDDGSGDSGDGTTQNQRDDNNEIFGAKSFTGGFLDDWDWGWDSDVVSLSPPPFDVES